MRAQQKLPPSGPEREALREKGQFWTPDWVAEAMVGYVLAGGSDSIFDPAVGAGAFFRAARVVGQELGRRCSLLGTEVDPQALKEGQAGGLSESDLGLVEVRDFVLDPPAGSFKAIVANPPYIRHHRLPKTLKIKLRSLGMRIIGQPLDGRAGIHVYFLLRSLQLLDPAGGRLAFIVPADTCEGVFAPILWNWVSRHYRIDAVVTFDPEASPFPGVDTNPLIIMIRRATPARQFLWARCTEAGTNTLKRWTLSQFRYRPKRGLVVHRRDLTEGLRTGLSRPPCEVKPVGPSLVEFATVLRGIATGANEFFFMTQKQAEALAIPRTFLVRAIGRTRDVPGDVIDEKLLAELDASGRPTLLFCPDGRRLDCFPAAVRRYLKEGERKGLPQRPLIATRRPWYKMEVRKAPPVLFAYLGRRNARFVRNLAGVVPLTGFLCVYPRSDDPVFLEKLWSVLSHPATLANLPLVGKSYGSGCIKVEPRALERLVLPEDVVRESGLAMPLRSVQEVLPL
ncbi:MAG: N-6 DNA methylase [Armatimonadota bacterium]|nr:N-6 DNA methylase [Armatimonadota bacterium]